MDPVTIAALAAAVIGPLIGGIFASGEAKREAEMRARALAEYTGLSVPQLKEIAAKELGRTNMAGVSTDPELDAYEDESMARLADVGRSGGMTATTRARMEEARLEAAGNERSSREALLREARARGTVGYGDELTAMLQAGQSSADRERMAGVQALSDAEQRALGSIAQLGSMAGERQSRQWSQRAAVATAQDRIDEFNARSANDFAMFNEQQRWRQFDARLDLANARANAHLGQANSHARNAQNTRETWGGVGQGVSMGLGAYAQHRAGQASQPAQPVHAKQGPSTKRKVA